LSSWPRLRIVFISRRYRLVTLKSRKARCFNELQHMSHCHR
jgi:hypothetical protein